MKKVDGFDILPCPFCGDDPKVTKMIDDGGEIDYFVECETRECPAETADSDIEHWNKRASK